MTTKGTGMTNRERVMALLRREKPDRVPIWPIAHGFCSVYAGGTIADAYTKPDKYLEAQHKACRDFDWVFFPMMSFGTALASEFGGEIEWPTGDYSQAPSISRNAVETVEDVMKLQLPDIRTAGTVPIRIEYCKLSSCEQLDNEPFNVMSWMGGPFTNAACISGVDKMCRWMVRKPEAAHRLMRLTVDYYIELAKFWKETFGVENVLPFFGEPTAANQIISPRQFEIFAMPYIEEISQTLLDLGHKHIFVHVCGEQNLNLPFWSRISFGGPGIISIGHEVKLDVAAKYFPNDIIMGNLEPAIIQTGTPEVVYEATRAVVEQGKKIDGGFIFSPGCELPPKSPPENVMMITRAVNDFGWY
jgi:uroporphyrinogen decarboxylase